MQISVDLTYDLIHYIMSTPSTTTASMADNGKLYQDGKELVEQKDQGKVIQQHQQQQEPLLVPIIQQSGSEENGHLTTYPAGWRHIVTIVAFFGFLIMYALRVNMSVALVAMVNHTAVLAKGGAESKSASICTQPDDDPIDLDSRAHNNNNTTARKPTADGPYEWSSETQGIILGAFFYGYIMTQFMGGVIAGKYGAKWVFGIGNCMTGVLTLLSPAAAEIGVGAFIVVRMLQGFSSGVTWPSMQAFYSRWAPPSERSTLPAIAYAGSFIGTPITFAISGVLAGSGFLGGWPSLFYVFGIICCVWFIFWAMLSSSGPENHKFISRGEQTYIVRALETANKGSSKPGLKDVPWKRVLTSTAVWAVILAHFSYNWSLYVLLTFLPTYFKRVQGLDIKKNGVLSALPYVCQFIIHITSGRFADYLRVRFSLRTVTVRKIFDCLGHFLPAVFVILVGYVGCNPNAAVAMLTLTIGCTGLCGAGWFVNFLDIAPQFAGILFGVSNTFSTIPGIVGPYLTGYLTKSNTIEGWRTVFFIIAALYLTSSIFFAIFGQGTVQPWAMTNSSKSTKKVRIDVDAEEDEEKVITKV